MSKKKKKKSMEKRSKDALKEVCSNTIILGKFREIFGMYDHDQKLVAKALKRCVKRFLEEEDPDPQINFKLKKFKQGGYDDDDDDIVTGPSLLDELDESTERDLKVVRKKKSLDNFF